jgi:hypothetical protein
MEKINFIDDELLKVSTLCSVIHKENLENDLINNSDLQVKIINRLDKIRRERYKAKKEYNELYPAKYSYYSTKHEIVPENEKEKELMIESDEEMKPLVDIMIEYDLDIKQLEGLLDVSKQTYWNITKIISYRYFLAGEKER